MPHEHYSQRQVIRQALGWKSNWLDILFSSTTAKGSLMAPSSSARYLAETSPITCKAESTTGTGGAERSGTACQLGQLSKLQTCQRRSSLLSSTFPFVCCFVFVLFFWMKCIIVCHNAWALGHFARRTNYHSMSDPCLTNIIANGKSQDKR